MHHDFSCAYELCYSPVHNDHLRKEELCHLGPNVAAHSSLTHLSPTAPDSSRGPHAGPMDVPALDVMPKDARGPSWQPLYDGEQDNVAVDK